jgi:hypothetical protein
MNWYNENEQRNYPLDDSATCLTDDNVLLPSQIIADLSISAPLNLLPLYIGNISITDTLIGVTICSSVVTSKGVALLNAAESKASIQPGKAYPLDGFGYNLSGWIVFGNIQNLFNYNYRFSTPAQSKLIMKAVKVIPALPIEAIKVNGKAGSLSGVVELVAGNDIVLDADPITKHITVRLLNGSRYASLCQKTTGGCKSPPIYSINQVFADANGMVTIKFRG